MPSAEAKSKMPKYKVYKRVRDAENYAKKLGVNYPDPSGSGLVIPNFVSGLTDGRRFTPTDTEFEDKPNGRQ